MNSPKILDWKRRCLMNAHALKHNVFSDNGNLPPTLYDLIAAINENVKPEEDDLVTATVMDLFGSGAVKWKRTKREKESA